MPTTSIIDQVQSAHVNEDMKPWRGHSCPSPYWSARDELDAPDSNRLDDLVPQSAFSVPTPSVRVEGRRSPRVPSITQPSALLLFGKVISTRDEEMEPQTHTVADWDTTNPHSGGLPAFSPPETRKREPRAREMCKVSNTTHKNVDKDQLTQYERRKLSNRQAARRSRSKKAGQIERLRQWVGKLLEENHALKSHIQFVNGRSMHWRPQEFDHLCHSAQSAQTAVDSMLNNAQVAAVPGVLPCTGVELTYSDLVHGIISEKNATVVHDGCSNLEMENLSSGKH